MLAVTESRCARGQISVAARPSERVPTVDSGGPAGRMLALVQAELPHWAGMYEGLLMALDCS